MNTPVIRNKIRAFAPATVANVGSGFDVFGFALEKPGDEVELEADTQPGLRLISVTGDKGRLPLDVTKNTAGVALEAMMTDIGVESGIRMKLHKKMPICSGMGSSAASAVAAVFAFNQMLNEPLPVKRLISYCIAGERISSGRGVHLDNIAASLFGGFVLIRSRKPVDIISLPVPDDLFCAVIHPHIEIRTSDSREMLRDHIQLSQAVTQWANIAGVVAALYRRDYQLLRRSLNDVLIEPIRSILIPHFGDMKKIARSKRVIGFSISGSGPSVFALCRGRSQAEDVASSIGGFLSEHDIPNDLYTSRINLSGPTILS